LTTGVIEQSLKKKLQYSLTEVKALKLEYSQEPPPSVSCLFCGKTIEPVGQLHPFEYRIFLWNVPQCNCKEVLKPVTAEETLQEAIKGLKKQQAENRQKQIVNLVHQSKIGERFRNRSFENFTITPGNKSAYEVSKDYAENFETFKKIGEGLMFYGAIGTGKTHLASAIGNYLLKEGVSVVMGTLISLLEKIKQSWNEEGKEKEIIDLYENCDLLIIDDLGKERASEWVIERLFSIVNERYERLRPVIITTNYNEEALKQRISCGNNTSTAEAIVSRLFETCKGVGIKEKDWRRK